MMPIKKICPYPGLRPFTEEESIFFKGRDEHIEQVTRQLEKKKFLMLTGASGDGKSSLVYAGVIPNARAGFFKAKYSNWLITSFRPERTPLKNMAAGIARQLNLNEDETLKELGFGFSALVNLYTSSHFYVDYNSEKWKNADESAKKQMKKQSANLFILVDQFEEFFTNPENYSHGVPSKASQTVVNLLLETAKATLAKDLPIYIICTMRSDYIGQCASFRDLPGYIGFSQFFVPRLKRKELIQVVEEPALLSGSKITQRLVELLLNELSEGYDQLPVLQHALNKIWNTAQRENSEMDLIHFAKTAGLPPAYLPQDDKTVFRKWLETLPDFKKNFFQKQSLEQVLAAHADELFETAHEKAGVNKDTAQNIIKTAFQCLTRIDENRAVRSRMTMGEITEIINHPLINHDVVDATLDIFREQGNTFLSPFITDQPETRNLKPEAVLDITHESLIRNWKRLTDWAWEEDNNWNTFQDFHKQLKRWVDSGKSDGYLLPIGPLNYFEQWFKASHPNKFWLARYDESELSKEEKLIKAGTILNSANEFIRKSARNLWFTRTVMRYGVNRIAASFAVLAFVLTCSFYSYDYYQKRNDMVLYDITGRGRKLLNSIHVKPKTKADFIINCERLTPGVFEKILDGDIKEDTARFDLAFEMFQLVQNLNDDEYETHNPLMLPLMRYMDEKLSDLLNMDFYKKKVIAEDNLRRLNYLLLASLFYLENDTASDVKIILDRQLWNSYKNISALISKPADSLSASTTELNQSFLLLGALKNVNTLIDFESIIKTISPFEGVDSKKRFEKLFPEKIIWKTDREHFLSHQGGYQIMGCLYGAMGKSGQVLQCIDSLIRHNEEYKNNDHNGLQALFGYCSKGGFDVGSLNLLLKKYAKSTNTEANTVLRMIIKKYFMEFSPGITAISENRKYYPDFISNHIDSNCSSRIWDACLFSLQSKEPEFNHLPGWLTAGFSDEEYFKLALYYKQRGIFTASLPSGKPNAETYFYTAFDYFSRISGTYLKKDFTIGSGNNMKVIKYSGLFLYPGMIDEENDWNPYYVQASNTKLTFPFLDYIVARPHLYNLYKTETGFNTLERFLYEYIRHYNYKFWATDNAFRFSVLENVLHIINKQPDNDYQLNSDFKHLVMMLTAMKQNDTTSAFNELSQLGNEAFEPAFQNLPDPKGEVHKKLLQALAFHTAMYDMQIEYYDTFRIWNDTSFWTGKVDKDTNKYETHRFGKSFRVLTALTEDWRRRNTYIDILYGLQLKGMEGPVENTLLYLDTLMNDIEQNNKFGTKLLEVMGMIGSREILEQVMLLIKNIKDEKKPNAFNNFIKGIAWNGYYYEAIQYIPEYVSSGNELELYTEILKTEILKRSVIIPKEWEAYRNKADDRIGSLQDYENQYGGSIIILSE